MYRLGRILFTGVIRNGTWGLGLDVRYCPRKILRLITIDGEIGPWRYIIYVGLMKRRYWVSFLNKFAEVKVV